MSLAEKIYRRRPIPFSTINFIRSTEQPLHSDAIHFGSMPSGLLCGAWIALEDISKKAGPLIAVPGSHKFPEVTLDLLGLEIPRSPAQLKKNYSYYEEHVKELVVSSELGNVVFDIPAGCCVFWDSNLLHGAIKQEDLNLTRYSQVTHYHFEGAQYYNPLYTSLSKNQIAYRDVFASEIK
jgi:ectoine hydroxylase-related dioxygenase (phytanoyl-CoA dioxygenase family)